MNTISRYFPWLVVATLVGAFLGFRAGEHCSDLDAANLEKARNVFWGGAIGLTIVVGIQMLANGFRFSLLRAFEIVAAVAILASLLPNYLDAIGKTMPLPNAVLPAFAKEYPTGQIEAIEPRGWMGGFRYYQIIFKSGNELREITVGEDGKILNGTDRALHQRGGLPFDLFASEKEPRPSPPSDISDIATSAETNSNTNKTLDKIESINQELKELKNSVDPAGEKGESTTVSTTHRYSVEGRINLWFFSSALVLLVTVALFTVFFFGSKRKSPPTC